MNDAKILRFAFFDKEALFSHALRIFFKLRFGIGVIAFLVSKEEITERTKDCRLRGHTLTLDVISVAQMLPNLLSGIGEGLFVSEKVRGHRLEIHTVRFHSLSPAFSLKNFNILRTYSMSVTESFCTPASVMASILTLVSNL